MQFSRRSLYICALFLLFFCSFAFATEEELLTLPVPEKNIMPTKELTLRDAILLALRTNPNVRVADLQRISDKFALEVAHNEFMPQYTFTANTTFQPGSRPTSTINPQATLKTPLGTQLGLNYSQNITGSAGSGSSIVGTITQPLMQGFGPTVTLAPLQQAEFSEHTARLNLKNTIITTVTQVIQNYYALVQAENSLKVDQAALQDSLAVLEQYKLRIKAGQSAPLELAPQESQVASQNLQVTQDRNAIKQAYLTLLDTLGLDPDSKIKVDPSILVDSSPVPSIARSNVLALENDINYLQSVYQLKQDEVNLIIQQDAQRWTLNLVATKTITPHANTGVTSNFTNPLTGTSNIGTTNPITTPSTTAGGDSVQLNLTVPINDKALEGQLVNAKVQLDQQKIQIIEAARELKSNVINAVETLAFQQQQIKQAQAAVQYAQQAYDVELIKLRYGRSTVLSVTQLQTSLTQSQQSLIGQEIAYINAYAAFEALLGVTLDKWGIQIYY